MAICKLGVLGKITRATNKRPVRYYIRHGISSLLIICCFMLISASTSFANPAPQINLKSWKPASDEYWIRVDKPALRLSLFKGSTQVKNWPVAIGRGRGKIKKTRRDFITPAGTYEIWRVVQNARKLVWDPRIFGEPGKPTAGVYGAKLISFHNQL